MIELGSIQFDKDGLVPTVTQDAETKEVLLIAFMNAEAIERTFTSGEAHFWSRSRQKLWRKGEASGHTLHVERIAINCEANSLLLMARLSGPGACHDGYRSCYYRQVLPDGSFVVIAERTFDPETVYHDPRDELVKHDLRALYAGYTRLRDEDFSVSNTSRMLHDPAWTPERFSARATEELGELAGVLDGTHVHSGRREDIILEASQVNYWLCLAAIAAHITYDGWEPHLALLVAWHDTTTSETADPDLVKQLSDSYMHLGTLLARGEVHPAEPLAADLAKLRERLG